MTYNTQQLEKEGVVFSYTPFRQSATMELFDENWGGSCNVMSYQWIYQKARNGEEDFFKPTSYEITNPNLPHPVIVGDNSSKGSDVSSVKKSLGNSYKVHTASVKMKEMLDGDSDTKELINSESSDHNSAVIVEYIGSKRYHFGVIRVDFKVFDSPEGGENHKDFAHAIAFAKMSDKVSFFDPNHGEITFEKVEDFKKWFTLETREGCLRYITHPGKVYKADDLFPTKKDESSFIQNPQEAAEEKEVEYDNTIFAKILLRKRVNRKSNFFLSNSCKISSCSGANYVCPEEIIQDPKFKINEVDYHTGKDKVPVVMPEETEEVVAENSVQKDKEEEVVPAPIKEKELFLEKAEIDNEKIEENKGMAGFTYHLDPTPIPRPKPKAIPRPVPKSQLDQVVLSQQEIPDPEIKTKTKKPGLWQRLCCGDIDKQK
ncbi:MAG: hemophilus virulence surface antigen [Rickettsiaceae bacterium]|jgi:hypothetical protein|nr:hemophilus virulence surface antigen [Rickettsiaceae bacterium]